MKVHHFNVEEAEKHGVEKAVILYNLRFWLEKNKANGTNEHDGYYWTYNSASAFAKLFPYFKSRKVARLLSQLEDDGCIISGCYNQKGYDRTKWYTLPEFAVNDADSDKKQPETYGAAPLVNSDKWIGQNCLMDLSIMTNGFVKSDQPIPDSKPNDKPDSKPNDIGKDKKTAFAPTKPDGLSDDIWQDLLQLRKDKKASNSKTAWSRIYNSLAKAQEATNHSLDDIVSYWIMRDWKGFDHNWYINAVKDKKNNGGNHANNQSNNSSFSRETQEQFEQRLQREFNEQFGEQV